MSSGASGITMSCSSSALTFDMPMICRLMRSICARPAVVFKKSETKSGSAALVSRRTRIKYDANTHAPASRKTSHFPTSSFEFVRLKRMSPGLQEISSGIPWRKFDVFQIAKIQTIGLQIIHPNDRQPRRLRACKLRDAILRKLHDLPKRRQRKFRMRVERADYFRRACVIHVCAFPNFAPLDRETDESVCVRGDGA